MPVLNVNGEKRSLDQVDPETPLLWVLRDQLQLVGAKYGCGIGMCGACTVLLNGKAVRSCSLRVSDAGEGEIQTIEGLAARDVIQRRYLCVFHKVRRYPQRRD